MKRSQGYLSSFALCGLVAALLFGQAPASADTSLAPVPASSTPPAGLAWRLGTPRHFIKDTTRLDARFQGVIEKNVEYHAIIELETGARVEIALYLETAPNHVASFVSLVRRGYYDGLTFHRVIPGFMAQGGDPTGTGGGGPGYTVNAEFSSTPHLRGTLSMARTNDPNSAGSQFFICFGPTSFLDGKYTVFGQVVTGMVHVDALKPRDPNANPDYRGSVMKRVSIIEIRKTRPRRPRSAAPVTSSLPRAAGLSKIA